MRGNVCDTTLSFLRSQGAVATSFDRGCRLIGTAVCPFIRCWSACLLSCRLEALDSIEQQQALQQTAVSAHLLPHDSRTLPALICFTFFPQFLITALFDVHVCVLLAHLKQAEEIAQLEAEAARWKQVRIPRASRHDRSFEGDPNQQTRPR